MKDTPKQSGPKLVEAEVLSEDVTIKPPKKVAGSSQEESVMPSRIGSVQSVITAEKARIRVINERIMRYQSSIRESKKEISSILKKIRLLEKVKQMP